MKIEMRSSAPAKFQTPCLVVSLFQDEKLSGGAQKLNRALDGLLAEVMEQDGFKAATGETRVLHSGEKVAAPRLILLGLGKRTKVSTATLRKAAAKGARAVRGLKRDSFAITVPDIEAFTGQEIGAALVEGIELGLHLFNEFKSDDDTKNLTQVTSATLLAENAASVQSLKEGADFGALSVRANLMARRLVNSAVEFEIAAVAGGNGAGNRAAKRLALRSVGRKQNRRRTHGRAFRGRHGKRQSAALHYSGTRAPKARKTTRRLCWSAKE